MQITEDQPTQRDIDREFLLSEIERYFTGQIDADDLLCAIKTVKPAKEVKA